MNQQDIETIKENISHDSTKGLQNAEKYLQAVISNKKLDLIYCRKVVKMIINELNKRGES